MRGLRQKQDDLQVQSHMVVIVYFYICYKYKAIMVVTLGQQ